MDSTFADLYAGDERILATISTRRERRKTAGVVKMAPSALEARKAALDLPWVGEDDESDEGDDEENELADDPFKGDESEDLESEDEEEDEDEDEEDEDEAELAPPAGKRKRSAKPSIPVRPAKKVAFAPEPKNTKQARSAAGAKGALAAGKKVKAAAPAKPPAKSKLAAKLAVAPKKVANVKKTLGPAVKAADGEEAYDFKKFF